MLNRIPVFLIYFRLLLGIIILVSASLNGPDAIPWIIGLILAGFFSDIFDGIIARKLNVSTVGLRKLDSIIDRLFWLLVLASCYVLHPDFIKSKGMLIAVILLLEWLVFVVSYIKFSRMPSPHNLLSKLWGIMVALTLIQIIANGSSGVIFNTMILLGALSRFDSLIIYILLREWDHDIPSLYHAYRLRIGKPIKRNDLLNG